MEIDVHSNTSSTDLMHASHTVEEAPNLHGEQEDGLRGLLKVEMSSTENSPRSPSLLQGIASDNIKQEIIQESNDGVVHSTCIKLENMMGSSSSQNSDGLYNGAEATWSNSRSFVNLSIPWAQRSEDEKNVV